MVWKLIKTLFKRKEPESVSFCYGCNMAGKCMMYGYGLKYGCIIKGCTQKNSDT